MTHAAAKHGCRLYPWSGSQSNAEAPSLQGPVELPFLLMACTKFVEEAQISSSGPIVTK